MHIKGHIQTGTDELGRILLHVATLNIDSTVFNALSPFNFTRKHWLADWSTERTNKRHTSLSFSFLSLALAGVGIATFRLLYIKVWQPIKDELWHWRGSKSTSAEQRWWVCERVCQRRYAALHTHITISSCGEIFDLRASDLFFIVLISHNFLFLVSSPLEHLVTFYLFCPTEVLRHICPRNRVPASEPAHSVTSFSSLWQPEVPFYCVSLTPARHVNVSSYRP